MSDTKQCRSRGLNNAEVIKDIKKKLPAYKVDYLCFKYAPYCASYEVDTGTFEELKSRSPQFPQVATEHTCLQWLLDDEMQSAVKALLAKKNDLELFELHQTYIEKARTDTNALKALLELNKVLFQDSSENELMKLLDNIPNDIGEEIE